MLDRKKGEKGYVSFFRKINKILQGKKMNTSRSGPPSNVNNNAVLPPVKVVVQNPTDQKVDSTFSVLLQKMTGSFQSTLVAPLADSSNYLKDKAPVIVRPSMPSMPSMPFMSAQKADSTSSIPKSLNDSSPGLVGQAVETLYSAVATPLAAGSDYLKVNASPLWSSSKTAVAQKTISNQELLDQMDFQQRDYQDLANLVDVLSSKSMLSSSCSVTTHRRHNVALRNPSSPNNNGESLANSKASSSSSEAGYNGSIANWGDTPHSAVAAPSLIAAGASSRHNSHENLVAGSKGTSRSSSPEGIANGGDNVPESPTSNFSAVYLADDKNAK